MNFNCDYGSRAVSFSSITTTAGWSRKPQPLLKLHMHEQCRISIWYHCNMYVVYLFLYFVYLVSADPDIGDIDGK